MSYVLPSQKESYVAMSCLESALFAKTTTLFSERRTLICDGHNM